MVHSLLQCMQLLRLIRARCAAKKNKTSSEPISSCTTNCPPDLRDDPPLTFAIHLHACQVNRLLRVPDTDRSSHRMVVVRERRTFPFRLLKH